MSAKIGGRSANRGECAQACRRKYTLVNNDGKIIAKDKYLLSMKDFCAEKYLADLIKAGVTSFKIEGRLKDETYVKNIVLYYRRLLDKYEKSSKGVIISDFEPNVYKTFNRGYTTYFLGKKNDVFNFDTPKSIGEEIGRVSKIDKKCFEIKTKAKIFPQDGLCFINKEGLLGFLVNKVENGKIYPNKMPDNFKVGDLIYRNKNVKFESDVKNSKTRRVIPVEIEIYKTKIKATDRECEAEIEYKFDEISKNEEKMKENFIKSFKKSGESIFLAEKIIFKTDVIPFLPISAINALRSELYLKLENLRLDSYKTKTFEKTRYAKYTEVVDYRLNIHNKKALEFYKKCEVEPLEYSLENTGNYEGKELMRTKHCIRRALSMCLKEGGKSEKLFLILDNHEKYPLIFDCKNCEMVISN